MALNKEIWISDLEKALVSNDDFMATIPSYDAWVSNNKVHIPQQIDSSHLLYVKNPTAYPLTGVTSNSFGEHIVSMDHFAVLPFVLSTPIEDLELAFDKRAALLASSTAYMNEQIADNTLLNLAKLNGVTIYKATGASRPAKRKDQTGTRKAITLADIQAVEIDFDLAGIPLDGRYLLIDPVGKADIVAMEGFTRQAEIVSPVAMSTAIGQIGTFTVLQRDRVLLTLSGGTTICDTNRNSASPTKASNNSAMLAYSKYFIGKAKGNINVFAEENKVDYQSTLMSYNFSQKAFGLNEVVKGVAVITEV